MRSPVALVVALLAALVVVGCGGGGGGGQMGGGGASTAPAEPPPEAGQAQGGRVVIDLRDLQFVPEEAEVPAGATVIFTNSDEVSHTVTKRSGPGPDFDSGPIEPGGSFSQVLSDEGEIEIFDKNRPRTRATITVEEVEAQEEEQPPPPDQGGGDEGGGN
jgi:plastocyanin